MSTPGNSAQRALSDTVIINKVLGHIHVSASREQWQYGYWQEESKKACLMILEFRFHPGYRIPRAEIQVTFSGTGASEGEYDEVTVEAFGPSMMSGSQTREQMTSEFSVNPSLGLKGGPASLGLNIGDSHTSSYERIKDGFVEGNKSPAPGHATCNRITWCLESDEKQEFGIPRRFKTAIVVSYNTEFMMDSWIRVSGNLKQWPKMTPYPWQWWHRQLRPVGPMLFNGKAGKDVQVIMQQPVPTLDSRIDGDGKDASVLTSDAGAQTEITFGDSPVSNSRDHDNIELEAVLEIDFSLITLQTWHQLLRPEWTNDPLDKPDPSQTISDVISRFVMKKPKDTDSKAVDLSPTASQAAQLVVAKEMMESALRALTAASGGAGAAQEDGASPKQAVSSGTKQDPHQGDIWAASLELRRS